MAKNNSTVICFSDLNLLDWSVNNHLAVALGSSIYLWNAGSGEISQLLQMDNPEDYVGAVSWIKEGNYLAVGTSCGVVQVRPPGSEIMDMPINQKKSMIYHRNCNLTCEVKEIHKVWTLCAHFLEFEMPVFKWETIIIKLMEIFPWGY